MRAEGNIFTNCLAKIHQERMTPYSYHTDPLGNRYQHYKATFLWTYVIVSVLEIVTIMCGSSRFPNFEELGNNGHQAFAVIGLFGMAAFVGLTASMLHFGIERCRKIKDRSAYSVQVTEDDAEVELTETTGLVGQDKQGASIVRVENFHPLRMLYPATPIKTGLWIPMVGLAILAIAFMIKPDSFNEFAGNSPIVNGSITNCSAFNITQNATCVSTAGYLAGLLTLVLPIPPVLSSIALFLHHKGAQIAESLQNDETSVSFVR